MYNFYDDENQSFIRDIEYVKGLYDAQVNKVKQEEYMKDLLFADYVRKVKSHKSRYDYIDIFKDAISQIGKKTKKERPQLETVKDFVVEDFLNGDKSFKLTNIINCGYEGYAYEVVFEGYGQVFYIDIPVMKNITTENIEYAHNGMFVFAVKESEYCWSVKKMCYDIEEMAKFIKEYFELDGVNKNE